MTLPKNDEDEACLSGFIGDCDCSPGVLTSPWPGPWTGPPGCPRLFFGRLVGVVALILKHIKSTRSKLPLIAEPKTILVWGLRLWGIGQEGKIEELTSYSQCLNSKTSLVTFEACINLFYIDNKLSEDFRKALSK